MAAQAEPVSPPRSRDIYVFSSVIRRVAYDPGNRELLLTFVTRKAYRYKNVPMAVYAALLAARSKGSFFNSEIRDAYECEQMG